MRTNGSSYAPVAGDLSIEAHASPDTQTGSADDWLRHFAISLGDAHLSFTVEPRDTETLVPLLRDLADELEAWAKSRATVVA